MKSFLLKKIGIALILKLLTVLLSFIYFWQVAHSLDPYSFGQFSLFQLLLLIVLSIGKQGLDQALIRVTATCSQKQGFKTEVNKITSKVLIGLLLTTVALYLLSHISLIKLDLFSQKLNLTLCFVVTTITLGLTSLYANILKGFGKSSSFVIYSGLMGTSIAGLLLYLSPSNTIDEVLVQFTIATCLNFCFCFLTYLRASKDKILKPDDSSPVVVERTSANSYWISAIVFILVQQGSSFYLSQFSTVEDLGIFNVVLKLSTLPAVLLLAINSVLANRFALMYQQSKISELNTLYALILRLLVAVSLLMLAFYAFFGSSILKLFGNQFHTGFSWLIILIIGQMFNLSSGPAVTLLNMAGYEKLTKNISSITAVYVFIFGFIFTYNFGALGAAITCASAMAIQNTVCFYFTKVKVLQNDFSQT